MRECNLEPWKVCCVFHVAIKCLQSLRSGDQVWNSHMFTYGSNVVSTPDVFCRTKNFLANRPLIVSYELGIGLAVPGYGPPKWDED